MPIPKRYLLSLAILAATTGCNQPRSDSTLAELQKTNADLSEQLDAANKRIEETETKMTSLQAEMKTFKQGYDSEKREQLTENIEAVEQLLTDIRRHTDSATETLQQIQELKAEVEKLKNLCVKHEAEASDANQIGQVKTTVSSIEQSVNKLERSIGLIPNIGSRFRQLESKVRQLESKVRRLR